jgi:hypothetical protein
MSVDPICTTNDLTGYISQDATVQKAAEALFTSDTLSMDKLGIVEGNEGATPAPGTLGEKLYYYMKLIDGCSAHDFQRKDQFREVVSVFESVIDTAAESKKYDFTDKGHKLAIMHAKVELDQFRMKHESSLIKPAAAHEGLEMYAAGGLLTVLTVLGVGRYLRHPTFEGRTAYWASLGTGVLYGTAQGTYLSNEIDVRDHESAEWAINGLAGAIAIGIFGAAFGRNALEKQAQTPFERELWPVAFGAATTLLSWVGWDIYNHNHSPTYSLPRNNVKASTNGK